MVSNPERQEGAYHHGMNRGINGEAIFEGNLNKSFFLDFLTHDGKRSRGELLVRLKDWDGLTDGEINKMPPFDRLTQGSLGKLYLDAKARLQKDDQKK